MNAKLEQLTTRLGQIEDLRAAAALLEWDQQTYMPPGAAQARAVQLATLARASHDWFLADEVGQALQDLAAEVQDADYDSFAASLVRVTQRDLARAVKVPSHLVAELAHATSLAQAAWQHARAASDFAAFRPHLETVLDLTAQKAEALGYEECPYDALLDDYEPGMKASQVRVLFDEMKAGLVPLVQAIAERLDAVDDSVLSREYEPSLQWELSLEMLRRIGFDLHHGRQDISAHPFTTSFTPSDVRLTTAIFPNRLTSGLLSSLHEGGHGLYEQGMDRALDRTPLSSESSLGVHESQSRMWENIVGRSRGFWVFWLPRLKQLFGSQLDGINLETFYRAVNRVEPSPIRIDADEVTYNLHIFMRFEIENLMLEHRVRVADLPELWNQKMEEYLGIRPKNDAEGVLQDIHWADGLIGYFPTYSLGNLLSVLFYRQALAERPEIPSHITAGDYAPLLTWLQDKIYRHGAKYTPAELVERVTGGPICTAPYLEYMRQKFGEIYRLDW